MKVSIIRIAYREWERCEIGNWLAHAGLLRFIHPELAEVRMNMGAIDYPDVAVCRNRAIQTAREVGADVLVMSDDDMSPHRNFLATALKYLVSNPAAVVGSPACGARKQGRLVNVSYRGEDGNAVRVSRSLAARQKGMEKVYCMGAGVVAVGMKVLDLLQPPYFKQTYNEDHTLITVTEDMYFTQAVSNAGGDVLAAWDCWSDHSKQELISKPQEGDL